MKLSFDRFGNIVSFGRAFDLTAEGLVGNLGSAGQTLVVEASGRKLEWGSGSGGSAASVATDTIFDAKGDLIAATGADAAVRVPVGTNGQVLTADSVETAGLKWTTPSSGSSGSGNVLVDPAWTAKGDVLGGTGNDTAAILPVGTNGQVLTADSATGTGLKWDTPSSGSSPAANVLIDPAWAAKGDLLGGTGNDTAAILGVGSNGQVLTADSAQATGLKWATPSSGSSGSGGNVQPGVMQARLTLTTAVPVTVSNVTAATTIYLTPFRGNRVTLYVSSVWTEYTLTERSASLSGLTANTNYDVFLYDNAGTLTLDLVAWTNATTRATALTLVDGVAVKSGANERLYVGTLRITSTTGQCEDSTSRRYVWNAYNRLQRNLLVTDTTDTWNYAVTAWRAANGSAANKVEYVCGLSEDLVVASVLGQGSVGSGIAGSVGVGVDTDSANSAQLLIELVGTQNVANGGADYFGYPGLGYHYLQWIEYRRAGTVVFYGDAGIGDGAFQSGLMAVVTG